MQLFRTVYFLFLLVSKLQYATADPEGAEVVGDEDTIITERKDERKPSQFKVGDEWLSLPEVHSNLDFFADNTPVSDEDAEGQLNLRNSRFWGRLYMDGWPQTVQFFRAHFGIAPPTGMKTFVFAEPRDACIDLTNAEFLTEDHVVLVHRGTCTYGTKAINVHKTKASSVIIINNEPGIDHLPGPDAHDIQFSVISITQLEGQLLEAVYDEGPVDATTGFGRALDGYMVPINCENSGARCVPATLSERQSVKHMMEGGTLSVKNGDGTLSTMKSTTFPIEYLLAHFGTKVTPSNMAMEVVVAKPAEACGPLENNVKGKIVLVRRGTCPFVKKAEEVQTAGGSVMVVGSMQPYIVRMGVEPRWKGLNTAIPVVMVSKRAYSILVAESYSAGLVTFNEDTPVENSSASSNYTITSETWEELEKLHKGEGWPRSESYSRKKYEEMKEKYAAWPDRTVTLDDAYDKKTKAEGLKSEL